MCGSESIIDIDVGEASEFGREPRLVLFFLGVEPQILEQDDAIGGAKAPPYVA